LEGKKGKGSSLSLERGKGEGGGEGLLHVDWPEKGKKVHLLKEKEKGKGDN